MISIGLNTKHDMEALKYLAYDHHTRYAVVRFDPAVNHAVRFAIADGLIFQQQNGLFRLTKLERQYVKKILKDVLLMNDEKLYLSSLSTKLTEDKINAITSLWRYSSAED